MNYNNPKLADLLAAEYVLGTLKGRARQRFKKLLLASPALRQRVQQWELRLNQLAHAAAPVTPPAAAWDSLQQRLFPAPPPAPQHGLEQLAFWRGLSLGSALLAGVLAVLLVVNPLHQEAPGYVVMINDTARHEPTWMVSTSSNLEQFYVKNMEPIQLPKDIRCVLWLQPEGSNEFYLLGVLPDKGDSARLKLDKPMQRMLPGQLLVTAENLSGPMPARPTSPPQFKGEWMPVEAL